MRKNCIAAHAIICVRGHTTKHRACLNEPDKPREY